MIWLLKLWIGVKVLEWLFPPPKSVMVFHEITLDGREIAEAVFKHQRDRMDRR